MAGQDPLDKSAELLSLISGTMAPVSLGLLTVLISGKTLGGFSLLIPILIAVSLLALTIAIGLGISVITSTAKETKKTNSSHQQLAFFAGMVLIILTYLVVFVTFVKIQS